MARLRPLRRLAFGYARLRFGKVPEPIVVMADHGGVFWTLSTMETMVEASWRALPSPLRDLAVLKAASSLDCPWCLDFGSHVASRGGLSDDKLRQLHTWRSAAVFDETERLVLELAEQMSATPVAVDPALVDRVRARVGDRGLLELVASIALENQRSRFNIAMGVLPQGWSRVCALPSAVQPTPSTASS
jgi:AhpD family alkylhydroperoxidase